MRETQLKIYFYNYNNYLMIKKKNHTQIIPFHIIKNIILCYIILCRLYNLQSVVTYTLVRTIILPLFKKVQTMCIIILFIFNWSYLL